MNAKTSAIIAVRVLAIFTFIKFIAYIQSTYSIIIFDKNQPDDGRYAIMVFSIMVPIILLLILSMVLWLYSDELSDKMVRNLKVTEATKISYEHLQIVAFSVVGLCLAANALPEFISAVINLKLLASQHMIQSLNFRIVQLVDPGLKLLIGLWLLLGSHGIITLLKRLRNIGSKDAV